MIIYLSGPMSGLQDFNRPTFNAVAAELAALNFTVLNPARHPLGLEYSHYMRLAMADLSLAEAVCTLPGWETSKGALSEITFAGAMDLPVIGYEQLLNGAGRPLN